MCIHAVSHWRRKWSWRYLRYNLRALTDSNNEFTTLVFWPTNISHPLQNGWNQSYNRLRCWSNSELLVILFPACERYALPMVFCMWPSVRKRVIRWRCDCRGLSCFFAIWCSFQCWVCACSSGGPSRPNANSSRRTTRYVRARFYIWNFFLINNWDESSRIFNSLHWFAKVVVSLSKKNSFSSDGPQWRAEFFHIY